MKRFGIIFSVVILYLTTGVIVLAATTVPNEIKQPGTQAGEISNLESPEKCDNCMVAMINLLSQLSTGEAV